MAILGAFAVPHPPIILPEIGRGEERRIQATIDAYREAMKRAAALLPDTVVVTSPHATMYADYFHVSPGEGASGDFGAFRAPEVKVTAVYDSALARAIGEACREAGVDGGTGAPREPQLDHGTMVPLRFLQECMAEVKVVRIGLSGMSPLAHYRFGAAIARAAEALGRRVVHIASGDLSHKLRADGPYGFAAEGAVFDRECMAALGAGDFLRLLSIDPALSEGAAECGLRSFWIMAGVLDGLSVTAEALSYEGPFGVGYGVAAFQVTGVDASRRIGEAFAAAEAARQEARRAAEDEYVKLARYSLETFVKNAAAGGAAGGASPGAYGAAGGGVRFPEKRWSAPWVYRDVSADDAERGGGDLAECGICGRGGSAFFAGGAGGAGGFSLQRRCFDRSRAGRIRSGTRRGALRSHRRSERRAARIIAARSAGRQFGDGTGGHRPAQGWDRP